MTTSDTPLSSAEAIINEARNGRMFILIDNEDRENEGDLVIPAQMATPDAINFMATHGRGLICLAMTQERVDQLCLPAMAPANGTLHQTAFTVSIEARAGVTTGISAADRARTIAVAIDANHGPDSIVTPGHVFPLAAQPGGVLFRAGHTEAAVDVARLAGLNPSGVICEIMKDDGTMARLDDLIPFAKKHGLKVGTIRDLIAYRRRHDHLVHAEAQRPFSIGGSDDWRVISYHNIIDASRHLVLQKGMVAPEEPTLVRMHLLSLLDDVLGCAGPRHHLLQRAIAEIEKEGSGLVVLLRPPIEREFDMLIGGDLPMPTMDLRSYGIGAQILADLGVHSMILLTNKHRNIVAIEGWDISVVAERPLPDEDSDGTPLPLSVAMDAGC
ncbi:MAG: 3,4-dihydroxy-2-butanone-4-phosphate synthase [Sphingobium sp.]